MIDKKLRDTLLKRWITRCKITHSLAFFQWRAKYEPKANRAELIEVFKDKKAKVIESIEEVSKKQKQLKARKSSKKSNKE